MTEEGGVSPPLASVIHAMKLAALRLVATALSLSLLASSTGCVGTRVLPPRTTPAYARPSALSTGREARSETDVPVVLDVEDGSVPIRRVLSSHRVRHERAVGAYVSPYGVSSAGWSPFRAERWESVERTTELICPATPCVTYLPRGAQTLVADARRGSSDFELLVESPALIRHALELREPSVNLWPLTIVLWGLGFTAAILGAVLLALPQPDWGSDYESPDYEGIGWGLTGGGAGLVALGSVMLFANRDELVTPGATATWPISF